MQRSHFGSSVVLAGLALMPAPAPAAEPAFRTTAADAVIWRPVPDSHGVEAAVIDGDPSLPGTYVIRVRFPPHVMDRPHWHSGDRYVTVLKGTWSAGTGRDFDPAKAKALPAGSFMFHPAGGIHWDGSNSDAEAIVQIIGTGPVTSTDVDPAQPSWVELPR